MFSELEIKGQNVVLLFNHLYEIKINRPGFFWGKKSMHILMFNYSPAYAVSGKFLNYIYLMYIRDFIYCQNPSRIPLGIADSFSNKLYP